MSKHTPGPWRWLNASTLVYDHGRRPIVLAGADGLEQRNHTTGLLEDFDHQSPDARLIAAAPELLSALLAVSTDNGQDTIEDPCGHADREAAGFYRIGKGAMDEVRRAIKKATADARGTREGAP